MRAGLDVELLTAIVAATRERLGAAACSVALLDGAELVFRAAAGVGATEVIGMRLPVGRGIAGWTVASGQAIAVADVHADRRFDREAAASTGYVPTTILAVPIEDDEGPIGVLEVLDRDPDAREIEIAALAADQVALVVDLVRSQAEGAAVLADSRLSELVDLVGQLAGADDRDRWLATSLLRAVLDQPRTAGGP